MAGRYFHNDWVSYWVKLPFRGGTVPNANKFYLCFADSNALTRASSKAAFVAAELLQQDGYARSNVVYSEDGIFSNVNKRHDLPLVSAELEATAALQFQTVFLIANGNANANKSFNAASAVDATANTISVTAHGLSTGEEILFTVDGGAALPGGLVASTVYKAIVIDADTFQVSNDGISPIDISSLGSGTCRLRYVPGHIVLLRDFDDPQLIQSGRQFFYDLQIAGFNATYGAGV